MAKRYVLLVADGDLSSEEMKEIGEILEERYGRVKMIPLKENPKAVVVKTDNEIATMLKEPGWALAIGGKGVRPALTSGAIVNLKRRASVAAADGQVPQ
ncbi:MAG TPA: hypothetical protein VGR56_06250 [Nitrososphaerales archaeon]|nr:hypothetical protein [Nitrososphaerales archaeon]